MLQYSSGEDGLVMLTTRVAVERGPAPNVVVLADPLLGIVYGAKTLECTAAIAGASVVESKVPVAIVPTLDHASDVHVELEVPSVDHPVRTELNRFGVTEGLFEEADASDDCAVYRDSELTGRPTVPGDLTAQVPVL